MAAVAVCWRGHAWAQPAPSQGAASPLRQAEADGWPSNGLGPALASPQSSAAPPGLTAIPPGDRGRPASLDARAMRRLGGLERGAAALAPAMQAYTEALREAVPALQVAAEEGARPGAQPDTPVPAPARAALLAAASRLAAWTRPAGVPTLAWAVHEEVVDAAAEVAGAASLRALLAPSQALLQALERQQALVAELLDLLGSKRAAGVFAVDDDALAAEVRARRGALARALASPPSAGDEARLAALEATLEGALDLSAFAQASATSTASRLGSGYLPLAQAHRSVVLHVGELHRALAVLGAPPPPAAAQLRAEVHRHNEERLEVELRWLAPTRPHDGASALQVVRRIDVAAAREAVAAQASCGALSLPEAEATLAELAAAEAPQTVGVLSGDAFAFRESLPQRYLDWPVYYRVVATSAFGVEAHAHEERARPAFVSLQPPRRPRARSLMPRCDDPNFYRMGDAVEVAWTRSASDPCETEALGDPEVPAVQNYEVYRLDPAAAAVHGAVEPALAPLVPQGHPGQMPLRDALPAGWRWAGSVPAGGDRFVDRPTLAELARGVAYVVVAIGEDGAEARVPGRCGQSNAVAQNLGETWALAAGGAARTSRPSAWERRLIAELAAPEALAQASAAFYARAPQAQRAAWQSYWTRLTEAERLALREQGAAVFGDAQVAELRAQGWRQLCARLRHWALLGCYVQEQPALRRAAAQHWHGLSAADRRAAERELGHALGTRLAAATTARVALDSGGPEAQLWAFWTAQGELERVAQAAWWEALGPEGRAVRLQTFWASLDQAQQEAATWPPLASLDVEERRQVLEEAPWPVPQHLWAPFFAFLAYDEAPAEQKRRNIAAEVGPVWRAVEAVHYGLRPLDVWTRFKLPLLVGLLGAGLVAGWLAQQLSQQVGPGREED